MSSGQRKIHVVLWLVLGPLALIGLAMAVVLKPAEPVQEGDLPGVEAASVDVPSADEGGGGQ